MRKRALPVLGLLALVTMAIIAMTPTGTFAAASTGDALARHHHPHFFLKKGVHKRPTSPNASGNNLNYGGGPVMGGTTNVFAIFWEPTGNVSGSYNSQIQRYFGDVNGSGLYNNNTQYS